MKTLKSKLRRFASYGAVPETYRELCQFYLPRPIHDDNEDAAISLTLVLKLSGHETRLAHDGMEAVAAAAAFRPDLVLLDIGLPKLDGYQVAQKIREQPWGQAMVLVALTGWGQEEDRKKSRDAGFNAHFVKPMDPAALTALVAGLPAVEGDSPLANRLAGGSGVPSISKARAANDGAPDAS